MTSDVRAQLADARLYLCTDARRSSGDLAEFLDAVLGAGVDIVQLREKGLEAREGLGLLQVFAGACRRAGRVVRGGAAAGRDVDYFCAGRVWATPTKPGRPATGPGLLAHVAGTAPARPWFAIGGISLGRLGDVLAAGATRVVVVRAITEADDPAAATRAFTRRLRPA